jgi:hypothetical protein
MFGTTLVTLAVACDRDTNAPPATTAASAATAAASAATSPQVRLSVDGKPVASVSPTQLASATPLADWLPAPNRNRASWRGLRATDTSGRRVVGFSPKQHPRAEVTLQRTADGQVVLRAALPKDPSLPADVQQSAARPIVELVGVQHIDVVTKKHEPVAPTVTLRLLIDGAQHELTAAELAKLPAARPRSVRAPGHHLRDVVATKTDVSKVRAVRIEAGDDSYALSGDDVRDEGQFILLRVNRRGALRLQHYGRDGSDSRKDLRNVGRVTVTTSPG